MRLNSLRLLPRSRLSVSVSRSVCSTGSDLCGLTAECTTTKKESTLSSSLGILLASSLVSEGLSIKRRCLLS
uniref:Uncharacterized protein n=1 Tax=Picea sitchensis TaxID=3332 RepID=A0A6B9XVI3_PICSI|nr:hypothetical protein Q903MT_gene3719 [Picea sitchensis]